MSSKRFFLGNDHRRCQSSTKDGNVNIVFFKFYLAISFQPQQYEESWRIGNKSEEILSNLNVNS